MTGLFGCGWNSAPPGMVRVPSGEFTMGTDETDSENHALRLGLDKPWFSDESPERRVYVNGFYIDENEVTNREFYIFSQATDHPAPRHWKSPKYPEGKGDLPVTYVSFYEIGRASCRERV